MVSLYSTIKKMRGPINIRYLHNISNKHWLQYKMDKELVSLQVLCSRSWFILSNVHRQGGYPYYGSDRCICAKCSCERRACTTTHPENIRGLPHLHCTLLAMFDVFSLCVTAELTVASTNGSPVAPTPPRSQQYPHHCANQFVACGL